jgi:hypothetical protein
MQPMTIQWTKRKNNDVYKGTMSFINITNGVMMDGWID